MDTSIKPVFTSSLVIGKNSTIFLGLTKNIEIEIDRKIILALQKSFDGFTSLKSILDTVSNEEGREILDFIKTALSCGVIYDARIFLLGFSGIDFNPQIFDSPLGVNDLKKYLLTSHERHLVSPKGVTTYQISKDENFLKSLIEKRFSSRSFSGDIISEKSLINSLYLTYGNISSSVEYLQKTVPSAGALYPLSIYLSLEKDLETLKKGIYSIHFFNDEVSFHLIDSDITKTQRSLLDPVASFNSVGTIIISGSFFISAKKYGSRALRYVYLEAGHAAQNFHLSAVNESFNTLELGGFYDEHLIRACQMGEGFVPLIAISFGIFGENKLTNLIKDVDVEWLPNSYESYSPNLFIASARIKGKDDPGLWSTGRSENVEMALIKAVSEAKEWYASSLVKNVVRDTFKEGSMIHPYEIVSYHKAQYLQKDFPFKRFDPCQEYDWTKGELLFSGKSKYVLADFVFFPFYHSRQYFWGNTSGTAAHNTKQKSVESATLELIERDSFMIHHLVRPSVDTILINRDFPVSIRTRVEKLRKECFSVSFFDYTLDLAPVVFCYVHSDTYNYSTCSACSRFNIVDAISHALMECETSILHRLRFDYNKKIKPSEVVSPEDHALLYSQERFYKSAIPISTKSVTLSDLQNRGISTWSDLENTLFLKGLDPIVFNLEDDSLLTHISRVIVPGLIPLTFGYGLEAKGMKRLYEMGSGLLKRKISFSDFSKLPHPYN